MILWFCNNINNDNMLFKTLPMNNVTEKGTIYYPPPGIDTDCMPMNNVTEKGKR